MEFPVPHLSYEVTNLNIVPSSVIQILATPSEKSGTNLRYPASPSQYFSKFVGAYLSNVAA